jgi:acylphosphatase
MKSRAHVIVAGRVQGVFFRVETKRQAEKHGVNGWVRNMSDGNVEAVFEGEEENVKQLIEFCQHGPLGAEVTNVNIKWEPYRDEFKRFEVRYGH